MRGARGGPVGNGSRARSHRLKVVFGLFALVPILLWAAALSAHQNYFQALRLRAITHVESGERVAAPAANKHGAVSKADGDRNGPTVEREEVSEQVHQDHSNKVRKVKHPIEVAREPANPEMEPLHTEMRNDPEMQALSSDSRNCPTKRKPFHVLLTSEGSKYQEWQTKILHYHFKKQVALHPCTEMTGFTRVLASSHGMEDDLMQEMPTFVAEATGQEVHLGFHVINRPWSLLKFVQSPRFSEMIKEEYVYIMETDHLLLQDLPNTATPDTVVGFFFPYMDPKPEHIAKVVRRFYKKGPSTDLYPTGPSPTLMHVDVLKRIAQSWFDISVKLKHDPEADSEFGWALEMWGYTMACAELDIKHTIMQKFQIEPSATWHQNVTVENPYIFHYTFGHEYSSEGIPVVGEVGEWSLDKRRWTNVFPPLHLTPPPKCAGEATHVLTGLLNEAMATMRHGWKQPFGADTVMPPRGKEMHYTDVDGEESPAVQVAVQVMTQLGGWKIGKLFPVYFYKNYKLLTPEGSGSWWVEDANHMKIAVKVCNHEIQLDFEGDPRVCLDRESDPESCQAAARFRGAERRVRHGQGSSGVEGGLIGAPAPRWEADASHSRELENMMTGSGPWSWQGSTPIAFLRGGVLNTPWGEGKWGSMNGTAAAPHASLFMNFVGSEHMITVGDCHTFTSKRKSDGEEIHGWMQIPISAKGRCLA